MTAAGVVLWGLSGSIVVLWAMFAARPAAEPLRYLAVLVRSAPTPLGATNTTGVGFYVATVDTERHLAVVTDAFDYWLIRSGARKEGNVFGAFARSVFRRRYGDAPFRTSGTRRRGTLLDPSPLPVTGDGRRYVLHLGDGSRPMQRFAADGSFLPVVLTIVPLALFGLDQLLAVLFPFAAGHLWAWLVAHPIAQVVLATNAVLVFGLKLYHDTSLVGGWDRVVKREPRVVPDAVRVAADTNDPPGTAVASVRSLDAGGRLLLVGNIERRYGEVVRLQDGLVTTRSRAFLVVAVLVGLARRLLFASAVGVVGVVFLWFAVRSIPV